MAGELRIMENKSREDINLSPVIKTTRVNGWFVQRL